MNSKTEISKPFLAKIKTAYFIVFGVIFLLSFFAQMTVQYFIYTNKDDANVINIAGRQRMLSQRIARFTSHIRYSDRSDQDRIELKAALDLFEKSHIALKYGDKDLDISPPFNSHIFALYQSLDPVVKEIINSTKCILDNCSSLDLAHEFIDKNIDSYLKQMNIIVFTSSEYAEHRHNVLSNLEIVFFIAIILTMGLEVVYLLVPTHKRLLESVENKLEQEAKQQRVYQLAEIGETSSETLHEVKNFVSIIHGSNQLLDKKMKNSPELEPLTKYTDKISKNTQRVLSLCKRISSLTRMGEIKQIDPKEIVTEIKELFEDSFEKYDINFTVEGETPANIYSNATQISHILINLVKNAIHAVENVDVRNITLKIETQGKFIVFYVSDTGKGILSEEPEKIFDAFFTTKSEDNGTGLGLSLSKKIAATLGGDLSLVKTSNPTTFCLRVENLTATQQHNPTEKNAA